MVARSRASTALLKTKRHARLATRALLLVGVLAVGGWKLYDKGSAEQNVQIREFPIRENVAHVNLRALSSVNNITTNSTSEGNDDDDDDEFWGDYRPLAFGMSRNTLENGGFVVLICLSLYFFLGVSIVCDEFFVPALERMADQWDLSEEIAGATLMAAGGSAPELSTSYVGTFTKSSVGFGTIVGSAVFNILFVIGMCAVFSKGALNLTWWPLFRDSVYYLLSLTVLALFFGVITPDKIHLWESGVLLLMYVGYLCVMKFNEQLHGMFTTEGRKKRSTIVPSRKLLPESGTERALSIAQALKPAVSRRDSNINAPKTDVNVSLNTPFTFRAGILQMLVGQSDRDLTGAFAVTQIKGTMKETFLMINEWGGTDGYIDSRELQLLLVQVHGGENVSDKQVEDLLKSLDTNKDGRVDIEEFKVWYKKSAMMVQRRVAEHFHDLDIDDNGLLDEMGAKGVLRRLKIDDVDVAFESLCKDGIWQDGQISRKNLSDWLIQSEYLQNVIETNHEDHGEGDAHLTIRWPDECTEQVLFLLTLPFVLPMWFTIYDVRNSKYKNYYVVAFLMSILWIAGFSFFLVGWVTLAGNAVGIPVEVMGLTFLAAGTSIPDLLSSVIVAQKGLGDMAVSSSIGSNIFDVLIGLPLPWFSYGIYQSIKEGRLVHVDVVADTLFVSLVVLILMMASVVGTIHLCGWKMSKSLGIAMFGLYVVFLVQDLVRALA